MEAGKAEPRLQRHRAEGPEGQELSAGKAQLGNRPADVSGERAGAQWMGRQPLCSKRCRQGQGPGAGRKVSTQTSVRNVLSARVLSTQISHRRCAGHIKRRLSRGLPGVTSVTSTWVHEGPIWAAEAQLSRDVTRRARRRRESRGGRLPPKDTPLVTPVRAEQLCTFA